MSNDKQPTAVDSIIELCQEQMDTEEEYHMSDAERTGELAGAAQAAQQNFLQANAPQALEAPADNQQGVNQ